MNLQLGRAESGRRRYRLIDKNPPRRESLHRPHVQYSVAQINVILSLDCIIIYLLDCILPIVASPICRPPTTFAMATDDGMRSKNPRRLFTIDRSTAGRCQRVDISTYHRPYLTSLRLIINNHEKILSPPVVDLVSPRLITDNARTTNKNNGRVRIPQTPGLLISDEYNV